jgi:hypothetical protein
MSMTMKIRSIVFGMLLTIAAPLAAFAQCSGQAPSLTYCGNPTGSLALPGWKPFTGIPLPNIAGGTVLGNRGTGAAAASALTNPVLGIPGTSTGQIGFAGATSGTATISPQATAGTPTLTLPNTSGTFAVNATTPLALSATTGSLTCATCVTSSGGGAITGTAPISVSAAGVVSIDAPYTTLTASVGGIVYSGATNLAILSGTATAQQMLQSGASAAPAWSTAVWPSTTTINQILYSSSANVVAGLATANGSLLNTSAAGVPSLTPTPVLGVAGTTVGSIGFQNATSGTATLQPVTGALGTPTILIPAASGTMAVSAASPLSLDASTGALACATCVTSSGGGAITGTAPVAVSAAGAVSITGLAGGVLAGASPAFTTTPTLGASGTLGTITFGNATSGTVTLAPATGALGTVTATLPANTGTIAELNFAQTWTAVQTFTNSDIKLLGSSTGATTFTSANAGATNYTLTFPAITSTLSTTIASGAKALATSAISSATCSAAQTDTATGTLTTDVVTAVFNADPTAVTGYVPLTTGMLTIIVYPTADTVNFKVCNNTASSVTPGAITLNWRVVR